ncbi:MipA/OmpV family protein [Psychrosphaera sp. B3R10]|uniref:MipA/OmpV family protein n=1 Tax=unclassified Psychrosphaera TaxID=2641570 RepID=UPI001C09EB2D|nr:MULTISPECIES: MipA/OmpV family protein [unclassified Psychrosphaera]MBU2883097.1 MipA/OmpV family protein [Psychrosphaera sp. I2R16]MBU2988554.1 MipA/OmpV family protein [Psychrosphaera sp. B3R10]MDO6719615.1 MipA/OmpV family protein [Psychrosphaera sp. 1_MG-2023]
MKLFALIILSFLLSFSALADDAGGCQIELLLDCDLDMPKESQPSGWTFGVGVATAVNVPVYIGAKETRSAILPIPYINYRSPNLKIGQGGIVARLFDSEKWLLSVSLSGAIPVDSDDAEARKGMPDINAIFEFGPSLKYYLVGDDSSPDAIFLDMNIRQARTIKFTNLKLTSSPSILMRKGLSQTFFGGKVNTRLKLGYEFVSEDYANEFYGVSPEYMTDERDAFVAPGGFAGFRVNGGVRWQLKRHIVSSFFAYADISGAKYVDSPLVKSKQHLYGGLVYFYLFE